MSSSPLWKYIRLSISDASLTVRVDGEEIIRDTITTPLQLSNGTEILVDVGGRTLILIFMLVGPIGCVFVLNNNQASYCRKVVSQACLSLSLHLNQKSSAESVRMSKEKICMVLENNYVAFDC